MTYSAMTKERHVRRCSIVFLLLKNGDDDATNRKYDKCTVIKKILLDSDVLLRERSPSVVFFSEEFYCNNLSVFVLIFGLSFSYISIEMNEYDCIVFSHILSKLLIKI